MITVLYPTCRGPHALADQPDLSQYDLLEMSLREQRFTDFELIIVQDGPEAEHDVRGFGWLGDRFRVVRARRTPWRDRGAFCPASARNRGLREARGDLVLGLDDCTSFDPFLLELAAGYAQSQRYLSVVCYPAAREPPPRHQLVQPQSLAGGILSYPRERALAVGGHEERFDGAMALEDWEFSARLGVSFYMDAAARVALHLHEGRRRLSFRCCHAVWALLRRQPRGNVPWTEEQRVAFGEWCPYAGERDGPNLHCGVNGGMCDHRERPDAEARAIIAGYESAPWDPFGVD